jgi:hypothetical protein
MPTGPLPGPRRASPSLRAIGEAADPVTTEDSAHALTAEPQRGVNGPCDLDLANAMPTATTARPSGQASWQCTLESNVFSTTPANPAFEWKAHVRKQFSSRCRGIGGCGGRRLEECHGVCGPGRSTGSNIVGSACNDGGASGRITSFQCSPIRFGMTRGSADCR